MRPYQDRVALYGAALVINRALGTHLTPAEVRALPIDEADAMLAYASHILRRR